MTESQKLLADFAETGSESAFRVLLARYLNLVYSSAFRLSGDTHTAQDVAQTVFIDLAKKAGSLPKDVTLGGWLHHHTVFVASNFLRSNRRRQAREREAVEMNAQQDHTRSNLAQLTPVLDEAIDKLEVEDRTAICLRFFEEQDFRTIGEMLNTSEEAARKRVARALEKLHSFLTHHGVSLSVTALAAALAANAMEAAPADLEAIIVGKAVAKAASRGALGQALSQPMTKTIPWVAGVGAAIIAIIVLTAKQQQNLRRVQEENSSLRQQMAELTAEIQQSSRQVAQAGAREVPNEQMRELLRLRGQVAMLNRQLSAKDTRVAAIVNGRSILQSEVRESIAVILPQIQKAYSSEPAIFRQKWEELWTNNVEAFINNELAVEDFDRRGLKVSEQELSDAVGRADSDSKDKESCRRRIVVTKMLMENVVAKIAEPTQEEIEQYYSANQKEFWQEDRVNLSRAEFAKNKGTDPEVLRKDADSVRQRAITEGVSSLMSLKRDENQTRFTVCEAWYDLSGLRPELAKVAASLNPSGISEAIETPNSLFILQVLEKSPAHQQPLDEVTNQITKKLFSKKKETVLQVWHNRLQSQAAIERFPVPQDL